MQFDSTPGGCPNMFGPHNDWHNRFAHPRCGSKNAPFYGLYNVGYNFQWSTFLFANLRRRDDATEFGSGPLEKTKVTRLQSSGCNVTVGDINGCVCFAWTFDVGRRETMKLLQSQGLANARGKVLVTSHICNPRSVLQCFELVEFCVLFPWIPGFFFIIVVLGIYVHGEPKLKLTQKHTFRRDADACWCQRVSCFACSKDSWIQGSCPGEQCPCNITVYIVKLMVTHCCHKRDQLFETGDTNRSLACKDSITYLAVISVCGKTQRWSEALLNFQHVVHASMAVSENLMNSVTCHQTWNLRQWFVLVHSSSRAAHVNTFSNQFHCSGTTRHRYCTQFSHFDGDLMFHPFCIPHAVWLRNFQAISACEKGSSWYSASRLLQFQDFL